MSTVNLFFIEFNDTFILKASVDGVYSLHWQIQWLSLEQQLVETKVSWSWIWKINFFMETYSNIQHVRDVVLILKILFIVFATVQA